MQTSRASGAGCYHGAGEPQKLVFTGYIMHVALSFMQTSTDESADWTKPRLGNG